MRRLAICVALSAAFLGGCGGTEQQATSGGGPARGDASRPAGGATAPGIAFDQAEEGVAELGSAGGGASQAAGTLEAPAIGPTVIKTADLAVEVERDSFGDAMATVTQIAAGNGGFVVSSTRFGEESRGGSVVVRIPSDRFETALDEVRGLGKVKEETVSGEDVGQEFVDLEARLRNLQAQEAVLLRLFDDATSVADTIRIQGELSGVQLEIERIEGRLRYLRDQTELGTISVSVSEEGVSAPGRFGSAFERAVDGLLAVLSGIVVFLGFAIPIAAVGVPLWLLGRRAMRTLGTRTS